MHPIIFKIGAFELRSYGFMLAISFLLGIYLAAHRAKKKNVDPNCVMDLSVVIIISSIVGSRLLYVLFHLEEFKGHWMDTFNPFQSDGQIGLAGLTVLGGVLLSFITSFIYIRIKKLSFLKLADIFLPSLGLGIFITRIGCYLNGCCFGVPCDPHWGVIFPPESPAGNFYQGIPIIPAQLYSSAYGLFIFISLLVVEKWQKFDGFLFYVFLILYGLSRFTIDMFRYYESSMVILKIGSLSVSLNQGISISFIVFGIVFMLMGYLKIKTK